LMTACHFDYKTLMADNFWSWSGAIFIVPSCLYIQLQPVAPRFSQSYLCLWTLAHQPLTRVMLVDSAVIPALHCL
jgi:hypothetical protein